jgi:hypothetical protein
MKLIDSEMAELGSLTSFDSGMPGTRKSLESVGFFSSTSLTKLEAVALEIALLSFSTNILTLL